MFKPHVRELYNYYSRINDFSSLLQSKKNKFGILVLRASNSTEIPIDDIIVDRKQRQNIIMKTIKNS